jgi:hypothetical protein
MTRFSVVSGEYLITEVKMNRNILQADARLIGKVTLDTKKLKGV